MICNWCTKKKNLSNNYINEANDAANKLINTK